MYLKNFKFFCQSDVFIKLLVGYKYYLSAKSLLTNGSTKNGNPTSLLSDDMTKITFEVPVTHGTTVE